MTYHDFCDHCEGCRPALIDVTTGKPLPPESLIMRAVNQIWDRRTTYDERKAFINVTLHNSLVPKELELARGVIAKISETMQDENP